MQFDVVYTVLNYIRTRIQIFSL